MPKTGYDYRKAPDSPPKRRGLSHAREVNHTSGRIQYMRTWGITATLITAALIAGCSSGTSDGTSGEPTAATSPTSTTEASPAETTEAAAEQPDLADEIRQAAGDQWCDLCGGPMAHGRGRTVYCPRCDR